MKKVLLSAWMVVMGYGVYAQCTLCTPVNCSATKPAGGLCNYLPDDTAGQFYDEVISFYMPRKLSDPVTLSQCGGCSSVDLRQIDIVGIQGLPPGMTYTPSQNGSYNVQGGDSTGCVRFCGTPVAPGVYYIVVNLLADVTANGTPIGSVQANDQPQQYRDTIEIFPGTSACPTSFDLGNGCITQACDSVTTNLSATLTNTNCPSLISYKWSFGNGQNSSIKNPGTVKYNVADTFPLTLVTTYYTYRVKNLSLNISGGYSGDVEELTGLSNPDPYIRINSLAFSNRGSGSDQKNITYNNLNLVIPDANCADALEIQVWDEDTGPPQGSNPLGSQDDLINSHNIYPAVPNQVSSTLSNSTVSVTFDTVATSSVTEVIDIVVFPHPPVPVLTVTNDSICSGDSTLITISPSLTGYNYTWYLNDTTQLLTADSAIYAKQAGTYKVKITNLSTGCSEWSAYSTVAVGQASPGNVNIVYNAANNQLFVSPFPTGFAVEWYYNGNLVTGQSGKFLTNLGNGTYDAYVYNAAFPDCRTAANQYTLNVSEIAEAVNPIEDFTVFPNPNNGNFAVRFSTVMGADVKVSVQNTVGQQVYSTTITSQQPDVYTQNIDLSDLSKGIYIVNLQANGQQINKRVVIQ